MNLNANNFFSKTVSNLKLTFRALRFRNFRLFYSGQFISLIGTWMQQVALSWLVYRLTGSVFLLGFISFISLFPSFVISPFAGVWTDRIDIHRILIWTQSLFMLQALVLAVLVLMDIITIQEIIGLSFFFGCINAFDIPARQAFVIEMIEDRSDLGNAIALNSAMFNATRFFGPSIAGVLIASVGEGFCFLINGLSYIAVIWALLAMQLIHKNGEGKKSSVFAELMEGFLYVFRNQEMKSILLLLALTSIMGMPFFVLMPAFAKDVLHGGAHTLGFLMSSLGAGALLGAFYLASRINFTGLRKKILLSVFIFGFGLIGMSIVHNLWSLLLVFLSGFGMMIQIASSNTWLQMNVEDDKRGRMISFFAVAFLGVAPFGSLLSGILADKLGVSTTLFIGGMSCILGALLLRIRNNRKHHSSC
ncbi:MAG: MFS transporter [Smithella sp.]